MIKNIDNDLREPLVFCLSFIFFIFSKKMITELGAPINLWLLFIFLIFAQGLLYVVYSFVNNKKKLTYIGILSSVFSGGILALVFLILG